MGFFVFVCFGLVILQFCGVFFGGSRFYLNSLFAVACAIIYFSDLLPNSDWHKSHSFILSFAYAFISTGKRSKLEASSCGGLQ